MVVYASGFAETAKPDRIEAQQRLIELAHRTGVRVVGPNCVGLANTRSGAGLNFMPDYAGMGHRRGPIGIVSQSGALGYTVLQGMERGIGFSHYLAAGNSCDVDVCDFISYLAEDDDTRAIVCLLEGVKDGGRFLDAARKARDAGKALIVYKTGNSETSSKAAMSHTGTMVGSVVAYRTAIEDAGAIAVDDLEAVLETAAFFAKTTAPRGRAGRRNSLDLGRRRCDLRRQGRSPWRAVCRRWKPKTASALHEVVPDFGSVANPSDLTAEVLKTSETFGFCLDAFLNDAGFSALVMPMIFAHAASSGARAPTIVEAAARSDRPLAVVWMNEWYQGPGSELLDADPKVCMFRSADRCFATLRAWFDWHEIAVDHVAHRDARCRRLNRLRGASLAGQGRGRGVVRDRFEAGTRLLRHSDAAGNPGARSRRRRPRRQPDRRPVGDQDCIARHPSQDRSRRRQARTVDAGAGSLGARGDPGVLRAMRRMHGSTASACSRWCRRRRNRAGR